MPDSSPAVISMHELIKARLSEDDTLFREEWRSSDAFRAMTNRLKLDRPRNLPKQQGAGVRPGSLWRVTLSLADDPTNQKIFTVEENAVLGSYPPGDPRVQVSLADWEARARGVSRSHAAIRTGPTRLLLLDLGSTNGTYLNSVPVGRGWAHTLSDGDLLTLGALSLWVNIVEQPAG